MVEAEYSDEIVRIREPVDLRFEMTSIILELDRAGRNPVVVFENAGGQSMPIVTNVAGNRKLLAACLGVPVDDLASAFRQRPATMSFLSPPSRNREMSIIGLFCIRLMMFLR
jgi:UbiD family decarboxylase